jgi:Flp pilus assembly protein TadB
LPSHKDNPPCPACGSSATLPFENDENSGSDQAFSEVILAVLLFFLALFSVLILLLLSQAAAPVAPVALLMLLAAALLWRRRRETRRVRSRLRRREFVCLDCSYSFKA